MTILRLRVSTQFGLGVDEAHYVLYGKILGWSYFDHPPLVGWVQALFGLMPIDHLIQARLSAMLISILTSVLIFNFLRAKNISETHSLYAVATLNLTPLFNAMSVALLPDTLLMPLTLLIIISTEKVLLHSTLKNWVLLGLWLGLAGLSKYTAVLYIFSLLLIFTYLIFTQQKKITELFKANLWVGVYVAAILISPVLYWNSKNNWISFQYQADHVLSADASILKNLGSSLLMQLISWGIGPFIVALIGFTALLKKYKNQKEFYITLVFLTVFLLFFIYVAVSEPLLPHWMLIYFILMIPLSYCYFLQYKNYKKILIASVVLSSLLSFTMLFELGFKVFPAKYTSTLYEGIQGWDAIVAKANDHLTEINKPKKALAVMNWTLGSRAMYYNNKNSEVFVIDKRFDQFDIWAPQSNIGYELLVIVEANKKMEHLAHLNCAQLTEVGEAKTLIKGIPVNHFLYYHCASYLEYKP
ncbi:MAG: glycosyltransferase family 39 protein [Bdellovibrionota bacterium]